ncbi:MAG: TIM barrel protein [Candidatus Zixiibacteriota bacterium]
MRLGGPIYDNCNTPEGWVETIRRCGYTAAFCPTVRAKEALKTYCKVAIRAGIVIAETGAWSNPLSKDAEEKKKALLYCQEQLLLADEIGARCCVNISGSRGKQWDGHDPKNFTKETFDLIVETVREIIDAVKPKRSFYTLETMPWMYPNSAKSYLALIKAVDRKSFAVHFDPVNLINSPEKYYATGKLIRDFVAKLGPYIRSCHAKDISLSGKLTVHLDEVRPGLGNLDYATYLTEIEKLDPDTSLMLEHLSTTEEYVLAADFIRQKAQEVGVHL